MSGIAPSPSGLGASLARELAALDPLALRRRLPPPIQTPGPVVWLDGRAHICLNSNNYLGLSTDPRVAAAACEATMTAGCSATGSRLLAGNLDLHERLEARLASFKATQEALVFNAGYMANLAVITALAGPDDLVVGDRLNHASLIDAARHSGAQVRHALHGRIDQLAVMLDKGARARRRFVVTDSVFSMDGDLAPVPELLALCERYEATLILDEAHATGVLGSTGRGSLEHFGSSPAGIIQVGTLGKALGGFGAFVACEGVVKDWLLNTARPFIFSTALPPGVLGAALGALEVLATEPQRVQQLQTNAAIMRQGLRVLGFEVPEGLTPIIPVMLGDARQALGFAQDLREKGILAQAVRPPAVPPGTSRIRVTVMASHTREQLDRALAAFEQVRASRLNS